MPFCCTLELKGNLRNVTSELFIFTSKGFLKTILCSSMDPRLLSISFTCYLKMAHCRALYCQNDISETFQCVIAEWLTQRDGLSWVLMEEN